uniref:Uncharacterized protein n=1 Tax=Anser brachyrhynchus TaxID=132585 RepID=A0A8B9BG85_9AVES
MASVPVYCLCRLPYDVTRFMIECDGCQDWFHGSEASPGPPETGAGGCGCGPPRAHRQRPVRAGAAGPHLPQRRRGAAEAQRGAADGGVPGGEDLQRPHPGGPQGGAGHDLAPPHLLRPRRRALRAEKEIEVMDVGRQVPLKMKLGDFVTYFCGTRRDRVLNVTGLEFSDTR